MKVIGHRGAKGLAPENTIASLSKALEYQVDMVEFDVRVTKDHVPVLLHDTDLHVSDGTKLRVSNTTYEDIQKHKGDIPTLAEAIAAVNRQVPLIIEIKPRVAVAPVLVTIQEFLTKGWQPSDLLIASFDYGLLQEVREKLPEAELVVNEMWSGVRASHRARSLNTQHISMYAPFLWSGFVRAMSRSFELNAFTINNSHKARRLAKYGLSGAITDFPDMFEK